MKLFHYVVQYNHFNITYRYKETIQENNLDVKRTPIIYQDLGKGQEVQALHLWENNDCKINCGKNCVSIPICVYSFRTPHNFHELEDKKETVC